MSERQYDDRSNCRPIAMPACGPPHPAVPAVVRAGRPRGSDECRGGGRRRRRPARTAERCIVQILHSRHLTATGPLVQGRVAVRGRERLRHVSRWPTREAAGSVTRPRQMMRRSQSPEVARPGHAAAAGDLRVRQRSLDANLRSAAAGLRTGVRHHARGRGRDGFAEWPTARPSCSSGRSVIGSAACRSSSPRLRSPRRPACCPRSRDRSTC